MFCLWLTQQLSYVPRQHPVEYGPLHDQSPYCDQPIVRKAEVGKFGIVSHGSDSASLSLLRQQVADQSPRPEAEDSGDRSRVRIRPRAVANADIELGSRLIMR
jgi:hypothetical protein